VFGTDLDFDGHTVHPDQGGVQGLVAIGLGNGDVVLEAARYRLVQVVHGTQHAIAHVHRVHDDTVAVHVHDLVEGFALGFHLVVDGIQVLFAAQHPGGEAVPFQPVDDGVVNLGDHILAIAAGGLDGLLDAGGAHRIHVGETQVFEFDTDVVHAQTQGDGRVDFERFEGDTAAFGGVQHTERTHVVQAIGKFDQYHPDVLGHRQHH